MTENKCSWEDGLGTSPSGECCGECNPTFAKRCPHLNKEKQIEEMAESIEQARIKATDTTNSMNYGFGGWYAKELYAKGYRKASEVAREIFEEIEKMLLNNHIGHYKTVKDTWSYNFNNEILAELAELKKKFTEDTDNET